MCCPSPEFICAADTTTERRPSSTSLETTTERRRTTRRPTPRRPIPAAAPAVTTRRPTPPTRRPTAATRRPTAEVQITRRPAATTFRPVYTQPPYRRAPSSEVPVVAAAAPTARPSLIFKPESTFGGAASRASQFGEEVRVQDAYRRGSAVVIQWESDVPNILGFRVVYRLFGDDLFKQGPPLAPSEKEFKIKNVPSQECIVVCVVSLEDIDISPETVPPRQCREIRTDPAAPTHMDTFVIAASAAICGTIVIAVIVFVCCNRRRGRERKEPLPSVLSTTPAPPLASIGTLRGAKDWDQLSMYSHRSIPRARMYHMDGKGEYWYRVP